MSDVIVDYREEDGWHLFTSKQVPELLVASPDGTKAYNDVPTVLEMLMCFNDGIECKFSHEIVAEEFFGQVDRSRVILRAELK